MLMPDLLPIRITNRDDLINNIKQVLKFSNSKLETPLAFFAMVRDDRERRMIEREAWSVDLRW
jgi:hypothetical protein